MAEDESGIVLRMYESENALTKARLTVNTAFEKAYVCNLLEEIETEAVVNGNEIEVVLKPYEVVTVLLAGAVPTQGSDSVAGHEIMRHEAKRRAETRR